MQGDDKKHTKKHTKNYLKKHTQKNTCNVYHVIRDHKISSFFALKNLIAVFKRFEIDTKPQMIRNHVTTTIFNSRSFFYYFYKKFKSYVQDR